MGRTVFVNGEYVDEKDARVSIFDRGYLFADGIYEVVPVIGGRLVDKAPFLARLERSLAELRIAMPMSPDDYVAMHEKLLELNGLTEGGIYSQVTRGNAGDRDFAFPKNVAPSVIAFTQAKPLLDNPKAGTGVSVISVDEIRWRRRDIKSIALLAQVLAKQAAAEAGVAEAWMIEDGFVTEGASSSAFIVKDGAIVTRPLSRDILPGIRRKVILELAREHQIRVEERPFTLDEALAADEAIMSSASTFVLPVVEIDGKPVGSGKPGPLAIRLRQLYLAAIKAEAGLA